MPTGVALLLFVVLPVLLAAAACLQLAFRWAKAQVPGFGASLGWVLVIGGAANGPPAILRNHVLSGAAASDPATLLGLQVGSCLIVPFFVIRVFLCDETSEALRVHVAYVLLAGLLVGAVALLAQLLR